MREFLTWLRANRAVVLSTLVVLIGGGALTIAVVDNNGDGQPDHVNVVVNKAPDDGAPTKTIEVPTAVVEASKPGLEGDLQTTPSSTPPAEVKAADEQQAEIRATQEPLPTAGASQGFAGCSTRFVVNQSSRHGVRPQLQVLHFTVSANRAGWSDVDAVVALFNRPSFQASSNFVIDAEGHCAYIVPIEAKAWTQAALNPVAVSYEVINSGTEPAYMAPAGYAKLRAVMQEVARRTGIPMRRGAVSGCRVMRSGIVQHADGGLCAGGHSDINPFSVDRVIAIVSAGVPVSPLLKIEQKTSAGIARPVGTGHSRRYWCQQNTKRRVAIRTAARTMTRGWERRHRGVRYQLLAKSYERACRRH